MCRGQAYDGASNMSGVGNEVQALVKREASCALYVHCFVQICAYKKFQKELS